MMLSSEHQRQMFPSKVAACCAPSKMKRETAMTVQFSLRQLRIIFENDMAGRVRVAGEPRNEGLLQDCERIFAQAQSLDGESGLSTQDLDLYENQAPSHRTSALRHLRDLFIPANRRVFDIQNQYLEGLNGSLMRPHILPSELVMLSADLRAALIKDVARQDISLQRSFLLSNGHLPEVAVLADRFDPSLGSLIQPNQQLPTTTVNAEQSYLQGQPPGHVCSIRRNEYWSLSSEQRQRVVEMAARADMSQQITFLREIVPAPELVPVMQVFSDQAWYQAYPADHSALPSPFREYVELVRQRVNTKPGS